MTDQITIQSAVANLSGLTRARELFKLAIRAVRNWNTSNAWLLMLNSQPLLRELACLKPRLIYKVYRPYLSQAFHSAQRLAALRDHYCYIFASGLGPLTLRAARTPAPLATAVGKSGCTFQLALGAVGPMEREGELVLQLAQEGTVICSCAFSFIAGEHGMMLAIGCLQGPKAPNGLQLVREATRELHGLRPKNLLMRLLGHLAYLHNCAGLRMVGNQNRVVTSALRQGKVFADYDELWKELHAKRRADGDFELACTQIAAPCLADIPSKKRAEMRRRHEILDGFAAAIRRAIAHSNAQYA